jgi:hypothetical protein
MADEKFPPITDDEIHDVRKLCETWWHSRWGSPMEPSTSRGLAKDVLRLLDRLTQVEVQLNKRMGGANNEEDFKNNPCTQCGSPPSVRCDHDE